MKDVLIVGFGIAGLAVAKQLEKRGKSFSIIADESQKSSKVAGGVLNPVALKRYNLAWKADELMPEAIDFYSQFNTSGSKQHFNRLPIFKCFSSIEDQNNWMVASDQIKLAPFLNSKIKALDIPLHSQFKFGEVLESYLLQLKDILEEQKKIYQQNNQFLSESFKHSDIIFSKNNLSYAGFEYQNVIFCEGFGVRDNPFFNWLPIYGNKGEYLIFKSVGLQSNTAILKSKHFIIPLGEDIYKFGATYSREQLDDFPTQKAREELENQLYKMLDCEFEVVDQLAGVRPTVRDRKPILGSHPKYKQLFILNGFGSRGVMAAPALSRQLIEHIYEGKPIEEQVHLNRFLKFFA